MIPISRTGDFYFILKRLHFENLIKPVGADRIVDEMIFKCTHTTVIVQSNGMYLSIILVNRKSTISYLGSNPQVNI